ncbi:hypothetical protein FDA48_01455 [Clostridium botulinum]|nr:hypothetical protein [Clostridium botulinum]
MKNKIIYWVNIILNVISTTALGILGYYTLHYRDDLSLFPYQLAITFMLVSGIWLYRKENGNKELNKELIKSVLLIMTLPFIMIFINGGFDRDYFISSLGSLFHAILLKPLIYYLDRSLSKLVGERAYINLSVSLVLIVILIALHINIILTVIIGLLSVEPINYLGFKKKLKIKYKK